MLVKPRFKYHFHVELAPNEDVVYLLSETGHYSLRGYLYRVLAPLLDGTHHTEEIVDTLKIFRAETEIRKALLRLEEQGFLVEAEDAQPEAPAAFWSLHGIDPTTVTSRLSAQGVSIRSFGRVPEKAFREQLQELDIGVNQDGTLAVAITDDYLQEGLREFNKERLRTQKPWLLVKPIGAVLWLGPLFIPGDTGCWYCLAHRLAENRTVESALQYQLGTSAPFPVSRAMLPSTLRAGYSLAATQLALCLARPDDLRLKGVIVTLNAATLETERHIVTKRPQCPVCGTQHIEKAHELRLQSRKKFFTEDGGHRIYPPAETFKRHGHLISPISGIVSELKSVFSDANGLISIYCGIHRVSLIDRNYQQLQASLRNNSTGKGKNDLQSRASAFSEAVERYCAVYQGHEFRIRKSCRQMDEQFVAIEDCMLFSDTQYQRREEWNRTHLALEYIPIRLSPEKEIDWTPVWSFTSQAVKYVPTAYCYLQYDDPTESGEVFYSVESNGLAAGNVLEEAILQGFFEVIERDAVSIWWYNRLNRPSVDLDSFHDSYFDALRDYYASFGREFWVLDLTTDSGISTFVAISRKIENEHEALTFGSGTHFDVRVAISRALTEMNQALYLMESGRMAERAMSDREQFMNTWNQTARLEDQPYLAPAQQISPKTCASYSEWYNEDIRDDLEQCFNIARNLGLDILVNDLSHPDVGMSVVKVIVPGLRHIRARFAPGRLYDVPVQQGWLQTPTPESEMNPITWWI